MSEDGLEVVADSVGDDIRVDDNVDDLFAQKMKRLQELGLMDERMMDKVNAINGMKDEPTLKKVRSGGGGSGVLGRIDKNQDQLVEFTGDDGYDETGAGFKPIANSGFKWSLPMAKRQRPRSPRPQTSTYDLDRDRDRNPEYKPEFYRPDDRSGHPDRGYDRDRERHRDDRRDGFDELADTKGSFSGHESSDRISSTHSLDNNYTSDATQDVKPRRVVPSVKPTHKIFEKVFEKKAVVEKKVEMITDIEAFIKDCNKKAEKPKPLIFDDIDDFIERANKRLEQLSSSSGNSKGMKRK